MTREMSVGFVGWPEEGRNGSNPQYSPNETNLPSGRADISSRRNCRDEHLYIQETLHAPSHQPGEGEGESGNTYKGSQGSESDGVSTTDEPVKAGDVSKRKSGLTRIGKKDKSFGARASIKTTISNLRDRFTPEQWEKFNDREFLRSIVSDWVREGRSQICKLDLMADKVRLVQSYLAKNPWDIEILWPSYFEGRITRTVENVVNGALPAEELEKYAPSLAIDLQSQEPEASQPVLEAMQELSGQNVLLSASAEGGAETDPLSALKEPPEQAPVEISAELEACEELSDGELLTSDGELSFMPEMEMPSSDSSYLEWNHPGGEPEPNWYALVEGENGELVEDPNWKDYGNSSTNPPVCPIRAPEASSSIEPSVEPIEPAVEDDSVWAAVTGDDRLSPLAKACLKTQCQFLGMKDSIATIKLPNQSLLQMIKMRLSDIERVFSNIVSQQITVKLIC